jgi:hypothetical protein
MKALRRVLKKLGDVFNRVLDTLLGQRQPEPELIPIPVRR